MTVAAMELAAFGAFNFGCGRTRPSRSLLSDANAAESLTYSGCRGNENRDTYANGPPRKTPGQRAYSRRFEAYTWLPQPNHALHCSNNNRALITGAGRARI